MQRRLMSCKYRLKPSPFLGSIATKVTSKSSSIFEWDGNAYLARHGSTCLIFKESDYTGTPENNPLICAVSVGNYKCVENIFLDTSSDISEQISRIIVEPFDKGVTLLALAIMRRNIRVVRLIIKKLKSLGLLATALRAETNNKLTPLMLSMIYFNENISLKILKYYAINKININHRNIDGDTILHYAFDYLSHFHIMSGEGLKLFIIKRLLEMGANPNKVNRYGRTCLYTIRYISAAEYRLLIQYNLMASKYVLNDVIYRIKTIPLEAFRAFLELPGINDTDILYRMIDNYAPIMYIKELFSIFTSSIAIEESSESTTKINMQKNLGAIFRAQSNGDVELVQLLCENGADLSARLNGDLLIENVVKYCNLNRYQMFRILVKYKALDYIDTYILSSFTTKGSDATKRSDFESKLYDSERLIVKEYMELPTKGVLL